MDWTTSSMETSTLSNCKEGDCCGNDYTLRLLIGSKLFEVKTCNEIIVSIPIDIPAGKCVEIGVLPKNGNVITGKRHSITCGLVFEGSELASLSFIVKFEIKQKRF